MDFLFATAAYAGIDAAPAPEGPGLMMQYGFLFAVLFGIWYFMLLRPQKKRQQEHQQTMSSLKKGDRVVTIGGVHGTVDRVKETTVVVKVDETARIEFNKTAIAAVNPEAVSADKEKGK